MGEHFMPGPWCLSDQSEFIVKQADVFGGSGGMMIASAHGHPNSGFFPAEAEAAANTRLIATAPDLLEMVKRYASECGECGGTGTQVWKGSNVIVTDVPCHACADIRSLIARATGEI